MLVQLTAMIKVLPISSSGDDVHCSFMNEYRLNFPLLQVSIDVSAWSISPLRVYIQ